MRNNGKMTCLYSAVQSDKIQMQLQSSRWQLYLMLLSPGSKLVNVLSQMDLKCFDHARSWRKSCLPSRPRFGHQWRRTNNANAMSFAGIVSIIIAETPLHFHFNSCLSSSNWGDSVFVILSTSSVTFPLFRSWPPLFRPFQASKGGLINGENPCKSAW